MNERRIAFVTVARSDYGLYRPILRALKDRPGVDFGLIVSGAHLSSQHGETVRIIERDGWPIYARVNMLLASDTAEATAAAIGLGAIGFAQAYAAVRPDLVCLLGDRFEMFAAGAAASPFHFARAHIHGGEVTEGAFDEGFRHSLSKLSQLHFASTEGAASRLRRMGEEPWRILVSGAPGLDTLLETPALDRPAFFSRLGIPDPGAFLLATYHPSTLEPESNGVHISAYLQAIEQTGLPVLFTAANADPGGSQVNTAIRALVERSPRAWLVENLGPDLYASALRHAALMVGNSSSGIIEAASFDLPVVNVGSRQAGRERGPNVLDCPCDAEAIAAAVRRGLTDEFRRSIAGRGNIYGDGRAGARIADRLAREPLGARLMHKRFADAGDDIPDEESR